jgi:hypothetical protein
MPSLALYLPGQQGWSATTWYASTDVCDAKVTDTATASGARSAAAGKPAVTTAGVPAVTTAAAARSAAAVPARSKVSAAVAEALYVKLAAKRLATVRARPFRTAADLHVKAAKR